MENVNVSIISMVPIVTLASQTFLVYHAIFVSFRKYFYVLIFFSLNVFIFRNLEYLIVVDCKSNETCHSNGECNSGGKCVCRSGFFSTPTDQCSGTLSLILIILIYVYIYI